MSDPPHRPTALRSVLGRIASRARTLDSVPRFPAENMEDLRVAGVLQAPAERADETKEGTGSTLPEEIALVRAVAEADASTARILDGHLNGVERLALCAAAPLREVELRAIGAGELIIGVWGADPARGEGEPAQILTAPGGSLVLRGVKTFCSGAGGVQRALVVASHEDGTRRLAYVDARSHMSIDRDWYRASGLRASESHRVEFHDAPVLALLGGENELLRQPWFGRDAVRTAATWAGIADSVFAATLTALGERNLDEHQARALGRMRVARATIARWLDHAGARLDDEPPHDPGSLAIECRAAISEACEVLLAEAVHACGSRALIDGGTLDRGRRDLDLFLLQHRLDPQLAKLGRDSLESGTAPR
jgi:alkylation response protein AidB-like acyl-CoA dehydrogenase